MIGSDGIQQVQLVGGDPAWLTLLGNGGIGILLGALVAWAVSRAGRKRSDLEHWRDTRHEAYSEILVKVDALVRHVVIATTIEINVQIPQQQRMEAFEVADRLAQELDPEVARVRLMGYPDVHRHLSTLQVNAAHLRFSEAADIINVRQTVVHHALSLENAMREQLGLEGTLKRWGFWETLWLNRRWWHHPIANRMFIPQLIWRVLLKRQRPMDQ